MPGKRCISSRCALPIHLPSSTTVHTTSFYFQRYATAIFLPHFSWEPLSGARAHKVVLTSASPFTNTPTEFSPRMGWDKLLVLVSPLLKSLLKGPPPSFQGLPPIWSVGLFQKANSPTVTCVQTSSHRPERHTILQNLSASLFLGTPFRCEGTQGSPCVRESFHKHPHPLSFPRG